MATCICSDRATHPSGCHSTAVDGKTLCTWCASVHTAQPRFRMLFSAPSVAALHREIRAFCAELDAREADTPIPTQGPNREGES